MFIQYARLIDFLSQVGQHGRVLASHHETEAITCAGGLTPVTFKVEIDLMHRDGNDDVHWLHYEWVELTHTADSLKMARKMSAHNLFQAHRRLYKELVRELRRFWHVAPGRFTLPREFVLMAADLQIVSFDPYIVDSRWGYRIKTLENWPSVLNDEFTSLYFEPQ